MSRMILAGAMLVAGCAVTDRDTSARDAEIFAEARPVGEPVNCIGASRIQHTSVRSDSVIDFHMRGRDVYRNTLPQACPGLKLNDSFTYRVTGSQLCSIDLITVNYSGGGVPGPTCGLGKFQPIEISRR
jgi:hypothetical protein